MKINIKNSLIVLIFICSLGFLVFFSYQREKPTTNLGNIQDNQTPQVLGIQTGQIRGIPLSPQNPQSLTFSQKNPITLDKVKAKSFYVYDSTTGQVLVENNAETQTGIASLTKLMTIYLSYLNLNVQTETKINPGDLLTVTPIVKLRVGDEIKYKHLIDAVLVGSSNDAAQLLGNRLSSSMAQPIAELMNAQAARLGMKNSQFSNPLGFDSKANYSTAKDIAILIEALRPYHNFTETGRLSTLNFTGSLATPYRVRATNKLISKDPELIAIKTGYTEGALGAMASEFDYQGRRITIIVIGSTAREADTTTLKDAIKENFILTQ